MPNNYHLYKENKKYLKILAFVTLLLLASSNWLIIRSKKVLYREVENNNHQLATPTATHQDLLWGFDILNIFSPKTQQVHYGLDF
jgi:hypothetical protein